MYRNGIYGAIIGDICGSKMEFYELKHRKQAPNVEMRKEVLKESYKFFQDGMCYTDDTVLTTALCDAILHDKNYEKYIKFYGRKEILSLKEGEHNKFGKMFTEWCQGSDFNQSYGNGCAMRISPIAFDAQTIYELERNVIKATICTHDHTDSIKCAMATAKAIYFAKNHENKQAIRQIIEETLGIKLNLNLKQLRNTYTFTSKAIESVPLALQCFLESNSFEETLRLTLSMGGDTDTNCAIACSVAGAFYGINQDVIEIVESYLPKDYAQILKQANFKFEEIINQNEHFLR